MQINRGFSKGLKFNEALRHHFNTATTQEILGEVEDTRPEIPRSNRDIVAEGRELYEFLTS